MVHRLVLHLKVDDPVGSLLKAAYQFAGAYLHGARTMKVLNLAKAEPVAGGFGFGFGMDARR